MPQQASITGESEEFALYFSKGSSFQVLVIFLKQICPLIIRLGQRLKNLVRIEHQQRVDTIVFL